MEKITVLVVDDQEDVARCVAASVQDVLIKKNQSDLEIEILYAVGPYKGLQHFSNKVIDVLITDQGMPMLDGEGLLRVVANISPATFLVLMTADSEYKLPRDLSSIIKLDKPVSDQILEETIDQAMEYFFESDHLTKQFLQKLYTSLYDHAKFIYSHLENKFITTNHYLANITGLFFYHHLLPF